MSPGKGTPPGGRAAGRTGGALGLVRSTLLGLVQLRGERLRSAGLTLRRDVRLAGLSGDRACDLSEPGLPGSISSSVSTLARPRSVRPSLPAMGYCIRAFATSVPPTIESMENPILGLVGTDIMGTGARGIIVSPQGQGGIKRRGMTWLQVKPHSYHAIQEHNKTCQIAT